MNIDIINPIGRTLIIISFIFVIMFTASCGESVDYNPAINPDDFVTQIDNQYLPLVPGTTFVYEGGGESIEVSVTYDTREILGVICIVIRDTVKVNDELEEDTYDWFAQDKNGDVWYFGEDSKEYKNGKVVSTEGSWEAGVDGAKPGIIMKANPQIGDSYRQEYYEGEAEDMAEVLALGESVTVPYGSFENCLKNREWTPLESDFEENKYYAPGIGLVLEVATKGGSGRVELIEVKTP